MAVFGETLRQARAYKGVTLKEAEQATRINRHHLAALEDENFAALPPLIYQRGIVRNYAAFLDLDPNKVLTMFEDAHGTASAASTVPMAVKPLEMPNHFTPNFAIIAFMVVLSAIVFAWVYSAYRGPSEDLPTPTMQTTVTPIATVDGAAPISATATPTPVGDDDAALASSPEADTDATEAAIAQAARPMSEANERRTQVAATQAAGGGDTIASATVQPTDEPTETTNVEGNRPKPTEEPDEPPTPNTAATEEAEVAAAEEAAAEEAAAAEQAAADEEAAAAEAQAAEASQLALDESLLTLSFSPTAGIYLTVIGDGTVIFDGNVGPGETQGPFNAATFEIYTSDPTSTNINNLDTGQTFYMGTNSFSLP
ncbi:MAG: Helix-turn-helix type 3 [uncultured Thermomicrobiales bacterium]|uniref:Helix-turn-helix type 3 n=1 Tax=uncultured Thermomicrobiales bacterium TaxID=1645740 RepID=A0A6J4VHE5_9BACT|nr:MAG: Helix-turn-helix type 3 [uncultured Thermomicrobiales bacterium]